VIKGDVVPREVGSARPRRFAQFARNLRAQLRDVRPEDLVETDRRELRLLFKELDMLARAKPGAAPVFPPLPKTRNG
jgi:hypothetical protein